MNEDENKKGTSQLLQPEIKKEPEPKKADTSDLSVSKIEMALFGASDPMKVLGLVQTPEQALDTNRPKVEEYIKIGCTDDQIAEALRLTTKKDFWSATHIKKARARWKRADKKKAETAVEQRQEHQSQPQSDDGSQSTTKQKSEPDSPRKFTDEEVNQKKNKPNLVYLRGHVTPPKVGETFLMPSGASFKAKEVRADTAWNGDLNGYEVIVERLTTAP